MHNFLIKPHPPKKKGAVAVEMGFIGEGIRDEELVGEVEEHGE